MKVSSKLLSNKSNEKWNRIVGRVLAQPGMNESIAKRVANETVKPGAIKRRLTRNITGGKYRKV